MRQLREEPTRKEAMEAICQDYWLPVYAFLRQQGTTPAEAEDLTQTFFARLLSSEVLQTLPEAKGKLRSYLLKSLQNHQIDDWRRDQALRRGGQFQIVSLDQELAENRLPELTLPGEQAAMSFDRSWFATVVEGAKEQRRRSLESRGRSAAFSVLEPYLIEEARGETAKKIAQLLGITSDSLRVTLHRFRQKFRDLVKARLAETVTTDCELAEEIDYFCQLGVDMEEWDEGSA